MNYLGVVRDATSSHNLTIERWPLDDWLWGCFFFFYSFAPEGGGGGGGLDRVGVVIVPPIIT